MNCRLDQLPHSILTDYFTTLWTKSISLGRYRTCLHRNASDIKKKGQYTRTEVEQCLPQAMDKCTEATIRVAKSIRFGGYMSDHLRELDPNVKVVHYVRDPRAMLVSAVELGFEKYAAAQVTRWAKLLCHRMSKDREHLQGLRGTHRVLDLRYEDLATDYMSALRRLYGYTKIPLPDEVINWFQRSTNASRDGGPLDTSRSNSAVTAYRWRSVIPEDIVEIVNNICAEVIEVYRYNI